MNMTEVEKLLEKLEKRIEDIWHKPPKEIDNIRNPMGVYAHSFPMINYAFHALLAASSEIFRLKNHAIKSDVALETLTLLAKETCKYYGDFVAVYGLTDTGELLNSVSSTMVHVKKREEYIELADKLCV